ncbi:MAG: substrate-binding domain-containing protein, partial [Eubacteriales bacterium]
VDAIVLSSISYEGMVDAVEEAMDAGVEVVIIDSDVNVEDIPVRISTDNYNAGLIMGEKMAELLDYKGQVGLVTFDADTANASQRVTGFVDAINGYEDMEIVCQLETVSSFDAAEQSTLDILAQYPKVGGLATFNEILTVGMSRAIQAEEREDLVCMGFDNNTQVVDYLERGILDAIVLQNQFAMGYLGAQYALELLNGTKHENVQIDTGVNVVTRENMLDTDIQTLLYPFDLSD